MALISKNSTALILVGGQGTRLKPLTNTVPKPIIPFANRPILHIIIDTLIESGVKRIILATSYQIKDDIAVRKSVECYQSYQDLEILFSKENEPLGTAGAIGFARNLLQFPCIVLNADITCEPEINQMMAQHIETGAEATILSTFVDNPSRYGVMEVSGNKVKKFWEKPVTYVGNRINAGVYIINETIMDLIDGECSIEKEVFPVLAERNTLCFYDHTGYWMDIGQAGDYIIGLSMYLNTINGNKIGDSIYFQENTQLSKNGNLNFEIPEPEICIDRENIVSRYIHHQIKMDDFRKNRIDFRSQLPSFAMKSVIHPSALIGHGTIIGPYSVIGPNVIIGNYVTITESTIMSNCIISDNVKINHSIVGWNCVIEECVEIKDSSVIGEGAKIQSYIEVVNEFIGDKQVLVKDGNKV